MVDVVTLAMERRATLKAHMIELEDFIRTAERLLTSVAQHASRAQEVARFQDAAIVR